MLVTRIKNDQRFCERPDGLDFTECGSKKPHGIRDRSTAPLEYATRGHKKTDRCGVERLLNVERSSTKQEDLKG